VRVRKLRDHQQGPGRPVPGGPQRAAGQVIPYGVLLAVGGHQGAVPAFARLAGNQALARRGQRIRCHRRSATMTGTAGRLTWTDVPGAMAAATVLGWSTLTDTSPDSSTLTRVTEPRKVFWVTMPLPPDWTAISRPSGRTSTSTSPDRPAAVSP